VINNSFSENNTRDYILRDYIFINMYAHTEFRVKIFCVRLEKFLNKFKVLFNDFIDNPLGSYLIAKMRKFNLERKSGRDKRINFLRRKVNRLIG